jgi:hypothetical protein
MTCTVARYGYNDIPVPEGRQPGELKEMTFKCDAEGCDVTAGDVEIEKAGGLRFMGWWAAGGKHYCPTHFSNGGPRGW